MNATPMIETTGLKKYFTTGKRFLSRKHQLVRAVDGVDISISCGETLGVVGESGCGKSTLGRLIIRLIESTEGTVRFKGKLIQDKSSEEVRLLRQHMQMIFQDPYASLNPRMTVYEAVRAPLEAFQIGTRQEQKEKVRNILQIVGLHEDQMYRYPHEFSGGQRQRVVIARALVLDPDFIVCDEPVSALDVSIQSQVLNLMQDIQQQYSLTYMFISHDLNVVKHISDRVAVMYLGRIVELADKEDLFSRALHPYTRALISAIALPEYNPNKKRILLSGDVPSPINLPQGCRFQSRCPYKIPLCEEQEPRLKPLGQGHSVACHNPQT